MPFIEYGGKKILFIHIPKTGGTTVETWLSSISPLNFHCNGVPLVSRCTPQHYRLRDFRQLFNRKYFDYCFSIVRNPYDRLESEYRMQIALRRAEFFRTGPPFSLWLERSLSTQKKEPFHLDNHLRPQWEFLGSGIDIFKFEDGLQRIVQHIATQLGLSPPAELPHELSTEGCAETIVWDRADRLLVREHFRHDFTQFGYPEDPDEKGGLEGS
jgi:hypothetical protein